MPDSFDLGVSVLNLQSQGIVLAREGVTLLGEIVHLRASLAEIALRIVEGRLQRVDEVDVGLQVRLAVGELLAEASDLW